MKIRVKELPYDRVLSLPRHEHREPVEQKLFFRWLMKKLSEGDLRKVGFSCTASDMERIRQDEPVLFLMNHSCFLDLEIAAKLLYPRQYHIVCTFDGFVGKEELMRRIGCIPTYKFVTDVHLVKDLVCTVKNLRSSVLLYPEASYSFDGTATPLPASLGKLIRILGIPVVMIKTQGAFQRDPLYNGLRLRDVKVTAEMRCLLTADDIRRKKVSEINEILKEAFTFDHFRWQQENRIRVDEPFRAEGLERVLYKCPCCGREGRMKGRGDQIACGSCGKTYRLSEYGAMEALDGTTEYAQISDWYGYERESVRKEIEEGSYTGMIDGDILVVQDTRAVYRIGRGKLTHSSEGFELNSSDGKLHYEQSPSASYSLYADYFWYEIGDMVCIGTPERQFCCFPSGEGGNVAKMRLAAEELYKMKK